MSLLNRSGAYSGRRMEPPTETRVLAAGSEAIAEAARLILAGEPVAVPTETVYGLAADASNAAAVARIYEAKGRPSFNPLIVHVRDIAEAERIARFDATATALAERWWPGPLTLVLPVRAGRALPELWPDIFRSFVPVFDTIGALLVYLSVLVCVLRGLPVVWEFVYQEKDSLVPRRVKPE